MSETEPQASDRTLYVFFTRRPHDREAWPLVYESRELAERAPHRVSPVVEVVVPLSIGGTAAQRLTP